MDGKGTKGNLRKAISYYKKAYEANAEDSQVSYGVACLFNSKDQKLGFELLKELDDSKDYMAYSFLKLCYEYGVGTEIDEEKVRLLEEKIENLKK